MIRIKERLALTLSLVIAAHFSILSLASAGHDGGSASETILPGNQISIFKRQAINEYERAVDLIILSRQGSNEEFNAFQNLMQLLTSKGEIDIAISRLVSLNTEALTDPGRLRQQNLIDVLKRKKSQAPDQNELSIDNEPSKYDNPVANGTFAEQPSIAAGSGIQLDSDTFKQRMEKPNSLEEQGINPANRLSESEDLSAKTSVPKLVAQPTGSGTTTANSSQQPIPQPYNPPAFAVTQTNTEDTQLFDERVFDLASIEKKKTLESKRKIAPTRASATRKTALLGPAPVKASNPVPFSLEPLDKKVAQKLDRLVAGVRDSLDATEEPRLEAETEDQKDSERTQLANAIAQKQSVPMLPKSLGNQKKVQSGMMRFMQQMLN